MNIAISLVCFGGFLLLPFAVLWFRVVRPRRLPWWAAFVVVIVLGWLLWLGAALTADSENSGGPEVFALFFGWAFALVWFIPWLLVYGIIQLLRRWYSNRNAQPGVEPNDGPAGSPDNSEIREEPPSVN